MDQWTPEQEAAWLKIVLEMAKFQEDYIRIKQAEAARIAQDRRGKRGTYRAR